MCKSRKELDVNRKTHYSKNKKKVKKNTLKEITFYVTGSDENSFSYEADYQRIKRIRKLLKDSISVVDFTNLKEEYYFIRQMIEFVYKNKDLEDALVNFRDIKNKKNKNKDMDININDYYLIVEALDYANVNKKYLELNTELKNLYNLFKSIIEMNNQYIGMVNNFIDLFQYDADEAINFTYAYRDKMLFNVNEINKQVFSKLNKKISDNKQDVEIDNIIKINIGDPIEDYEYNDDIIVEIDCKGQCIQDLDFNKYRDLKNVTYINLKDGLRKNKNNQ